MAATGQQSGIAKPCGRPFYGTMRMLAVALFAVVAGVGCSTIKDRVTRLPSSSSSPDFKGYCGHRRECDDDAKRVCGAHYEVTGEGQSGRDAWITYTCGGPSWFTNRDD